MLSFLISQWIRKVSAARTAEQSAWVSGTDCRGNTVTVEARAVARTYVEGMTAEFLLVSDEETVTVPGTMGETHAFTARLTGPLTDEITVSVDFLTEGQRQTQVLEQETMLLETGHNYLFAAVGMDEYDREWLAPNQHGGITTAEGRLDSFHNMELSLNPADWDY